MPTLAERCRRGQAASSALRSDRTRQAILTTIGARTVTTVRVVVDTGLSKSTVRRHLNALIRSGDVTQGVHPHDNGVPVFARTGGAR